MMFWLKALGWAKTALTALRQLVAKYPLQCALVALLCLSGWLWMGKREALAERDAARAQIVAIAKAQKEAERLAKQARAETERVSKDLAHATTEQSRSLDADSRRALADYRMRPETRCRAASATDSAPVPDSASGDLGTPANDQLVAVTAADLEAFRQTYVRTTVCRQWGQSLIDAGLAVAD